MAAEYLKKQEKSIGELLTGAGLITREMLEEALKEQQHSGEPLGRILVRKKLVTEQDIVAVLKGMLVAVFEINSELFGIEIVYTREILKDKKITPLPSMASHIRGVITVRNTVMPVVDLKVKIFGKKCEEGAEAKIIIVENKGVSYGALVDKVISVRNFLPKQVEYNSTMNRDLVKEFCGGIIKDSGGLITLIKPDFVA